jgi:hypothetical protein
MSDLVCPRCRRRNSLLRLPEHGERLDYACRACGLTFSISRSDLPGISAGRPARLVEDTHHRIWLLPRASTPL